MAYNYLNVPDNKGLVVQGIGVSPQASRSPSPNGSSVSGSETERSEEYTVLDGVKEMNEMLLKQIQAIRRQIEISEKTYNDEKAKILASNNAQLRQRDNEIINLTSSSRHKDENILQLERIGAEKDQLIQVKSLEIENLKTMIKQIQNRALKIQEKVKRALRKSSRRLADDNMPGGPRDEETAKLRIEIDELKARLATLEEELAKAAKVIAKQNEQMSTMGHDKKREEAILAEKLNKMSESMRRDVERTCQILLSNIEEMTQLKQQNNNICEELFALRNHLKILIQQGYIRPQDNAEDSTVDKAAEKPDNKEHNVSKSTERLPALDLKTTPKVQHERIQFLTQSVSRPVRKNQIELPTSYSARLTRPHTHISRSDRATLTVFQSEDSAPRHADRIQKATNSLSIQTLNLSGGYNINKRNVLPQITQKVTQGKSLSSARGSVKKNTKK